MCQKLIFACSKLLWKKCEAEARKDVKEMRNSYFIFKDNDSICHPWVYLREETSLNFWTVKQEEGQRERSFL